MIIFLILIVLSAAVKRIAGTRQAIAPPTSVGDRLARMHSAPLAIERGASSVPFYRTAAEGS